MDHEMASVNSCLYLRIGFEQTATLPAYNVTKLNFQEEPVPGQDGKVMTADIPVTGYGSATSSSSLGAGLRHYQ